MSLDVIGFGALNVDYIYRLDYESLPDKWKKIILSGAELSLAQEKFNQLLKDVADAGVLLGKSGGGQAANSMCALSGMGVNCGLTGKVGCDDAGEYLVNSLRKVDTKGIKKSVHNASGCCLSLIDGSGERCMVIAPGCNDEITAADVDFDYLKQAKLVYFSSFVGDSPLKVQLDIVRKISDAQAPLLALDTGELYALRGVKAIEGLLAGCRFLFITDDEIKLLTGLNYKKGARSLLSVGVQAVICKLGSRGAYVFTANEEFLSPVQKIKAVDRTGAGDVFAAGFIAGWLRGFDLKAAVLLGHKAAAYSLSGIGRDNYPDAG